jgi:hypothetical protein
MMIVVAAVAAFLAAVDLLEPASQELDSRDLSDSLPLAGESLLIRHLGASSVAMIAFGGLAVTTSLSLTRSTDAALLGAMVIPTVAMSAVCAAAVALTADSLLTVSFATPEGLGVAIFRRVGLPAVIAMVGFIPLDAGTSVDAELRFGAVAVAIVPVVMVLALVVVWLRYGPAILDRIFMRRHGA